MIPSVRYFLLLGGQEISCAVRAAGVDFSPVKRPSVKWECMYNLPKKITYNQGMYYKEGQGTLASIVIVPGVFGIYWFSVHIYLSVWLYTWVTYTVKTTQSLFQSSDIYLITLLTLFKGVLGSPDLQNWQGTGKGSVTNQQVAYYCTSR